MPRIRTPKIKTQIEKMRFAKKGERTLTQADKKKEMRNAKHKCQKCKKSFPAHLLDIHHKKGVASYKSGRDMVDIGYIEFYTKRKKKASYDKSKNLMVLCPTCHRKVHKEERERKAKKKPRKKEIWEMY